MLIIHVQYFKNADYVHSLKSLAGSVFYTAYILDYIWRSRRTWILQYSDNFDIWVFICLVWPSATDICGLTIMWDVVITKSSCYQRVPDLVSCPTHKRVSLKKDWKLKSLQPGFLAEYGVQNQSFWIPLIYTHAFTMHARSGHTPIYIPCAVQRDIYLYHEILLGKWDQTALCSSNRSWQKQDLGWDNCFPCAVVIEKIGICVNSNPNYSGTCDSAISWTTGRSSITWFSFLCSPTTTTTSNHWLNMLLVCLECFPGDFCSHNITYVS